MCIRLSALQFDLTQADAAVVGQGQEMWQSQSCVWVATGSRHDTMGGAGICECHLITRKFASAAAAVAATNDLVAIPSTLSAFLSWRFKVET